MVKERDALLAAAGDQTGMLQALLAAGERLQSGVQEQLAEAADKVGVVF